MEETEQSRSRRKFEKWRSLVEGLKDKLEEQPQRPEQHLKQKVANGREKREEIIED